MKRPLFTGVIEWTVSYPGICDAIVRLLEAANTKIGLSYQCADRCSILWIAIGCSASSAHQEEAAVKICDAHASTAEKKDAERIAAARWKNAFSALGVITLPPLIILVMGLAIRWALKGFRRPDPA